MVYRLMNLQRFQSPCRNYLDTGVITLLPTRSALDFVNGYNRSMRSYCPIPDPSFPLSCQDSDICMYDFDHAVE